MEFLRKGCPSHPYDCLRAQRPRSPGTAGRIERGKDSSMPVIDSRIHAYAANTPGRPWHSVPNWPRHVTGDEMVAAMDAVGVDGAISI